MTKCFVDTDQRPGDPPRDNGEAGVFNGVVDSKQMPATVTEEDDSSNPIERRYLFRRPRALQYFEHGALKKA